MKFHSTHLLLVIILFLFNCKSYDVKNWSSLEKGRYYVINNKPKFSTKIYQYVNNPVKIDKTLFKTDSIYSPYCSINKLAENKYTVQVTNDTIVNTYIPIYLKNKKRVDTISVWVTPFPKMNLKFEVDTFIKNDSISFVSYRENLKKFRNPRVTIDNFRYYWSALDINYQVTKIDKFNTVSRNVRLDYTKVYDGDTYIIHNIKIKTRINDNLTKTIKGNNRIIHITY